MFKLVDYITRSEVSPDNFVFTGEKNPWEVVMDLDYINKKINRDYFIGEPPKLLKYLPLMPIDNPREFVSLKENATPLISSKWLGKELGIDLYFKLEGKNPTGSFKDRGSSVEVSVAKEQGAKAVVLASTGNMAASCACYCALAQLPCFVIVPEGVPISKLAQVIAFGGKIIQVKGTYNEAADVAFACAKEHGFYLAGDYAIRIEGQKTGVFELIDQMNFKIPDKILLPIGCGTNMASYYKGLKEYHQLHFLTKMPELIGVQSTGANPVVRSYRKRLNSIEALSKINTLASAIAVSNPIDGVKALHAIYQTKGEAGEVSDKEIQEAQYLLSSREGLFVESASASVVAYLLKKSDEHHTKKTIVCILTGEGLKDPQVLLKSAIKPVTISPDLKEFTHLYKNNFFSSKTMLFIDHNKVMLEHLPSSEELDHLLFDLFGAHYEEKYLLRMLRVASEILNKGKKITLSDLQDIVQDVLEKTDEKIHVFSITDFAVTTVKDKKSVAQVTVQYQQQSYQASSVGAGPVDAVVNALTLACTDLLNFELKDYKVDIRSQGVDAVVYVEMKLSRGNYFSLGLAASPDIVQASITAFEDAYNGLFIQEKLNVSKKNKSF